MLRVAVVQYANGAMMIRFFGSREEYDRVDAETARLVATSAKAGARGSFTGIRRGASYSSHRSDYWIYAN
jgi:hypothetical protein